MPVTVVLIAAVISFLRTQLPVPHAMHCVRLFVVCGDRQEEKAGGGRVVGTL